MSHILYFPLYDALLMEGGALFKRSVLVNVANLLWRNNYSTETLVARTTLCAVYSCELLLTMGPDTVLVATIQIVD